MSRKLYRKNTICHLCGLPIPVMANPHHPLAGTIDHVIPLSLGGTDRIENRMPAHRRCNMLRGVRAIGDTLKAECRAAVVSDLANSPGAPISKRLLTKAERKLVPAPVVKTLPWEPQ